MQCYNKIVKLKEIKKLLREYKLSPSKRLGQNFLIDEGVLRKIIEAANLSKNDVVLEVGPGIGNLTRELAKRVKKVIAVEKDKKMIEILKEELKDFPNLEIIKKDILDSKFYILNSKFKVVANLPYYITSPVIRKFLEAENQPKEMILMVQKEVAQRICPCPPKLKERRRGKTPKMSILAVSVQFYAKPKIISYVSKKCFWPQPKVDSAILRIAPLINADRKLINADLFFKIVKSGFSQPRKQLLNNLSKGLKLEREEVKNWLLKNGVEPQQRAETLLIQDWLNLTKSYKID